MARDPTIFDVRVDGHPLPNHVSGAILIWGAISDSGREAVIAEYNFADVLSVEMMLNDLYVWMPTCWAERSNELRYWSDEFFTYLS